MTDGILERPRRLAKGDDRTAFDSGAPELDDWFRRFALENQQANNAVTYVTVRDGVVLGYYAIAMSAYTTNRLPERMQKNRPGETPCILLARLAVDSTAQGQGVGAALLRHAMEQSFSLSERVGAAALLIHCRDESAKAFYQANGDFLASPIEELHLVLSMKEIQKRLRD
ncbi:Acetyltransferase (GNAT) domain-containing protein [Sanguibacter gelidistatuariae]|uniref:Acetyltransferase (GNAT) domain-containing protein n=1 Tax=Sanguibacter gelidistatuariae TaxID=1814289 RepID=A0A1G6N0E9_9MICO|nr:GNAT family N-acetyltransferase [Sanguibacter gelidistatuariae]SDC61300.1 Acetyltransferase (GNAT) domain-containing protein [Sanguibacter gelidistatuariae]